MKNKFIKIKNRGFCKMCLLEKYLCKSHILPKHSYKILKSDGYAIYLNNENAKYPNKQKDYSGIFDKNILCKECECILSAYEDYGYQFIYSGLEDIEKIINNQKITIRGSGYDYKKIKLYFLSILWRASITDHQFFDQVKLSSSQEEFLRNILLNNFEIKEHEFPLAIFLPNPEKQGFNVLDICITQSPYVNKSSCHEVAIFTVTGQSICFFISNNLSIPNVNSIKKNEMIIHFYSEANTIKLRDKRIKAINEFYGN
jgi:hypothetical protein